MRVVCLLIFIFLSFEIFSEEGCVDIDLNSNWNSPFRKIPIYDQDGVGICYSYVASQMIDYYRLKNHVEGYDLTNPVYASWVTYYENKKIFKSSSLNAGGSIDDVIKAVTKKGVCSDKEVKERLKKFAYILQGLSDVEVLRLIEALYKQYHGFFAPNEGEPDETARNALGSRCGVANINQWAEELKAWKVFAIAPTKILSYIFEGCKKVKVSAPFLKMIDEGNQNSLKLPIDLSLKNSDPVAIGLCAQVFDEPQYRGLRNLSKFIPRNSIVNVKGDCAPHAVMITGQKMIKGRCQYLIRNSWGAFWSTLSADACACYNKKGRYEATCTDSNPKEYVGCWFSRDDVLANTMSVNVFH